MNRYRVINLDTNAKVCGFFSEATDWEGLLFHMNGYAKNNLPLRWALQKQVFGEWETITSNIPVA